MGCFHFLFNASFISSALILQFKNCNHKFSNSLTTLKLLGESVTSILMIFIFFLRRYNFILEIMQLQGHCKHKLFLCFCQEPVHKAWDWRPEVTEMSSQIFKSMTAIQLKIQNLKTTHAGFWLVTVQWCKKILKHCPKIEQLKGIIDSDFLQVVHFWFLFHSACHIKASRGNPPIGIHAAISVLGICLVRLNPSIQQLETVFCLTAKLSYQDLLGPFFFAAGQTSQWCQQAKNSSGRRVSIFVPFQSVFCSLLKRIQHRLFFNENGTSDW